MWLLPLLFLATGVVADVQVEDDRGQILKFDTPAQRIVSLAPHLTEMIFAIGMGERIIGADAYSNYPEAANRIPRVGNYAAINYEAILTINPDVVLAWQSGNGDDVIRRLRQLGLRVFVVEPRKLDDIPRTLIALGKITGGEAHARDVAHGFSEGVESLRTRYSNKPVVNVFYQVWNEPLITLNGEHIVSDVIRLCGGKNVFAQAAPLVPYVNIEAVIHANPEVIIASGSSAERPLWLDMWEAWRGIAAVDQGQIYAIPPDLVQRHSTRILEGARLVCEKLEAARNSR